MWHWNCHNEKHKPDNSERQHASEFNAANNILERYSTCKLRVIWITLLSGITLLNQFSQAENNLLRPFTLHIKFHYEDFGEHFPLIVKKKNATWTYMLNMLIVCTRSNTYLIGTLLFDFCRILSGSVLPLNLDAATTRISDHGVKLQLTFTVPLKLSFPEICLRDNNL